jgi:hypothetical protein
LVVFLSATLYAALSDPYNLPNRWFIRDDAYYYFKVAQNISEGHGSTFDGLHPTNGYHPLWLLICIPIFALARYDLILPLRVLAVVTGVLQVSTAILLFRLVRDSISAPAAVLAASFWCFSSYVLVFLYKTGVESNIALFLLLVLLTRLYRLERNWRERHVQLREIAALGMLAILVTFSRLDLAFFALIVGVWIVFRNSGLRYLLPLDIVALIVAGVGSFLLRLGFVAYYDVANSAIIMVGLSLLLKVPAMYVMGLYTAPSRWRPLAVIRRLLLAIVIGSGALALVLLGASALGIVPIYSRAVLLLDAALSFTLLLLVRLAAYIFRLKHESGSGPGPMDEVRSEWGRWLREGTVYYGIFGGALALYMLWNQLAFGTPTPVSGQIKQWWGTFAHSIYGSSASNWLTFFALNPFSDFNAWAPPTTWLSDWTNRFLYVERTGFGNPAWRHTFWFILAAASLLLVAIMALRKRPAVRRIVQTSMIPLFAGSWLQILAYNIPGYASPKEWYWLTEPVLLVILGAALLTVVLDLGMAKWKIGRALIWIAVAAYGIHGAFIYWRDAYYLSPYGLHPPGTPYTAVIPLLEKSTEPGAIIGMTGGGNVGYLMPSRTIVNMDGLINSTQYFEDLQIGKGADYLYETGMRYVFANPNLLEYNPYRGQYTNRLHLLVNWGGKDLLRLLPEPAN